MKNVGEKLTDEEAEKIIKETDVDDAQQSRSSITGGTSQSDSAGAGFGTNREKKKIVEDAQIITQEREQNRTVKQKLFTAAQLRLNTLKWNVYVERVVEQIIDVQKSQVMEKIVKFPKITQRVEDTQYRQSAVGENLKTVSSEQVANTRVQPTVNPVEVKQPTILKMTTQRKHSRGQERSQVNKQVEDAVKVKIIKMKVQ